MRDNVAVGILLLLTFGASFSAAKVAGDIYKHHDPTWDVGWLVLVIMIFVVALTIYVTDD